jgi:hypothetical protein
MARPRETTELHTRVLRCTLAVEDCAAYWQNVDLTVPVEVRAARAFGERWFGVKSEARVRTLLTNMVERFDSFPESLHLLKTLGAVPALLRPWICHLHLQLSDPIYRRFTGEFLPLRRAEGYMSVDRAGVAQWVEAIAPDRWSTATSVKFAANLLTAAVEAGIIKSHRDPRKLTLAGIPDAALGYALYLLRTMEFEGSLSDNPYLRSLGVDKALFPLSMTHVPGVSCRIIGEVQEMDWGYPSLTAWGSETLRTSA